MNLSSPKIDRRTFLRGVGGAVMALPHLNIMAATSSGAVAVPKRMVCVGTNFGFVPKYFFPSTVGREYAMPRLLKPLEHLRDQFTVFSNLDHGAEGIGGHRGTHAFLSGVRSENAKCMPEANVSVDQKAAEIVGSNTRYSSMQFTTGSIATNLLSWTKTGVALPPIQDLRALYGLLFQSSSKGAIRVLKKVRQENRSILDLVETDVKHLERRVGIEDQEKLDQYFTSVRSLERELTKSSEWLDRPKPKGSYSIPREANGLNFKDRVPLYYDLMALALQTDSSRVISFEISDIGRNTGGFELTRSYHQLTHHDQDQSAIDELLIVEDFHMRQFARFADKLAEIEEADGSSLLDHTMSLIGSGLGNASSHSNKDLPLLLAGGGFKHGQHMRFKKNTSRGINTPASNLYVSMLQQFGSQTDKFNLATGPLIGLETV